MSSRRRRPRRKPKRSGLFSRRKWNIRAAQSLLSASEAIDGLCHSIVFARSLTQSDVASEVRDLGLTVAVFERSLLGYAQRVGRKLAQQHALRVSHKLRRSGTPFTASVPTAPTPTPTSTTAPTPLPVPAPTPTAAGGDGQGHGGAAAHAPTYTSSLGGRPSSSISSAASSPSLAQLVEGAGRAGAARGPGGVLVAGGGVRGRAGGLVLSSHAKVKAKRGMGTSMTPNPASSPKNKEGGQRRQPSSLRVGLERHVSKMRAFRSQVAAARRRRNNRIRSQSVSLAASGDDGEETDGDTPLAMSLSSANLRDLLKSAPATTVGSPESGRRSPLSQSLPTPAWSNRPSSSSSGGDDEVQDMDDGDEDEFLPDESGLGYNRGTDISDEEEEERRPLPPPQPDEEDDLELSPTDTDEGDGHLSVPFSVQIRLMDESPQPPVVLQRVEDLPEELLHREASPAIPALSTGPPPLPSPVAFHPEASSVRCMIHTGGMVSLLELLTSTLSSARETLDELRRVGTLWRFVTNELGLIKVSLSAVAAYLLRARFFSGLRWLAQVLRLRFALFVRHRPVLFGLWVQTFGMRLLSTSASKATQAAAAAASSSSSSSTPKRAGPISTAASAWRLGSALFGALTVPAVVVWWHGRVVRAKLRRLRLLHRRLMFLLRLWQICVSLLADLDAESRSRIESTAPPIPGTRDQQPSGGAPPISKWMLELCPPSIDTPFWYESEWRLYVVKYGLDVMYCSGSLWSNWFGLNLLALPIAVCAAVYYALRPGAAAATCSSLFASPDLRLVTTVWGTMNSWPMLAVVRSMMPSLALWRRLKLSDGSSPTAQVMQYASGSQSPRGGQHKITPPLPVVEELEREGEGVREWAPVTISSAPGGEEGHVTLEEHLLQRQEGQRPQRMVGTRDHPIPILLVGSEPIQNAFINSKLRRESGGAMGGAQLPRHAEESPVVIYLHGGGLVNAFTASNYNALGKWATIARIPIVYVEYSLAPGSAYPTALDEVHAVYKWIMEGRMGILPTRVILAADSSGGHLAVGLVMRTVIDELSAENVPCPIPDGLVLAYPTLNLGNVSSTSRAVFMNDPVVPMNLLKQCASVYLPSHLDLETDPCVSPLLAPDHLLAKFPPTSVMCGAYDPFLDDSVEFVHRLQAVGVDCRLEIYERLPHHFFTFSWLLPQANRALELFGRWMRQHADWFGYLERAV